MQAGHSNQTDTHSDFRKRIGTECCMDMVFFFVFFPTGKRQVQYCTSTCTEQQL